MLRCKVYSIQFAARPWIGSGAGAMDRMERFGPLRSGFARANAYTVPAMKHLSVRQNRMLLAVASSIAAAIGVAISILVIASKREGPLLMSVMQTAATEQSMWPRADQAPAAQIVPAALASHADAADEDETAAGDDIRWFDGRPVRRAGTMTMLVTAYSPDKRSCGKSADGVTASGYSVWTNAGRLVAADTRLLPFGSLVSVPGYGSEDGEIVPVLDRGGKIKGNRLDVLYTTHERALTWGSQRLEVTVWEYADGQPSGFRTQH